MAEGNGVNERPQHPLTGWMIVAIVAIVALAVVGITALVTQSSTNASAPTSTKAPVAQTTAAPTTTIPATTTTVPVATTTTNPNRQILAPAATPPVVDECSIPLSYGTDGDTNPYCSGSAGVNVLAWKYFAGSYPGILGIGANATENQVLQAVCQSPPPFSQAMTSAQLAAEYYGWGFATVPTFTGWNGGDCPS